MPASAPVNAETVPTANSTMTSQLQPVPIGVAGELLIGGLGLARGGTPGGNSSGDIFLAFSTADAGPMPQLAPLLGQRSELNPDFVNDLKALGMSVPAIVWSEWIEQGQKPKKRRAGASASDTA